MISLLIIGVFLFAYLLGCIPTAHLLVKRKYNLDLRCLGSKNIGATNAKRVTNEYINKRRNEVELDKETKEGKIIFYTIATLDGLKGAIPVAIAIYISRYIDNHIIGDIVCIITGIVAVLGHDTMIFLKDGKGKGVSTSFGALLILNPVPTTISLIIFILLGLLTNTVAIKSLGLGISNPIVSLIMNVSLLTTIGSFVLAVLLIVRHKENIKELVK